jgi:hypothetical protein
MVSTLTVFGFAACAYPYLGFDHELGGAALNASVTNRLRVILPTRLMLNWTALW